MRTLLVGLALSSLVACSSSTTPPAGPDPTGNWDVTMAFDATGTCSGLPPTYAINFDIAGAAGGYTFTANTGLTGDNVSGTMSCDTTACTLTFADTGPVPSNEYANVVSQTIAASLIQDASDNITGSGTVTFSLSDGSTCTGNFSATGNVAH